MNGISFIHCADIHLGHLQFNEPRRLEDFYKSFKILVDYSLEKSVDFILISGDFFHKRAINAYTLEQAIDLLSPLKNAGIPVIAIEGNHDKAFYQDKNSWLCFLNNQGYLSLLSPEYKEGKVVLIPYDENTRKGSWIEIKGVRIYGLGYLGVTINARLQEALPQIEKGEIATILMLHGGVNRLLGQDLGGIKKEVLTPYKDNIDYIALGHIHGCYEIDNWMYNPGSLEYVHLDEHKATQKKGYYHVSIDNDAWEITHISSKYRPAYTYKVDITETLNPKEAYDKIYSDIRCNPPEKESQVQVVLYGMISYNPVFLELDEIINALKEEYSCLYIEIQNNTNLPDSVNIEAGSIVKRDEIEKIVFSQLLQQEKNWQEEELDKLIQIIGTVKETILSEDSKQEVVDLLLENGNAFIYDEEESDDKQEKEVIDQ